MVLGCLLHIFDVFNSTIQTIHVAVVTVCNSVEHLYAKGSLEDTEIKFSCFFSPLSILKSMEFGTSDSVQVDTFSRIQ